MQCKDIPNEPILHFLAQHGGIGCTLYTSHHGEELGILSILPEGTPEKVARAKMGKLIRSGLVSGCICGCRGDFELTAKGRAAVS